MLRAVPGRDAKLMKHLKVTIYGLDDDAREIIDGTITLRNGRLVGHTEEHKLHPDGPPVENSAGDDCHPGAEADGCVGTLHPSSAAPHLPVSTTS